MTVSELPNLVLTVEEAAEKLRVGRTTMYGLIKSGAIKAVRIGGSRRVPLVCIQAYLNQLLTMEDAHDEVA